METKIATSVRLSPTAHRLLAALGQRLGISNSAALELAIRQMAKREKVEDPQKGEPA